jgi:HEAT repeat protein
MEEHLHPAPALDPKELDRLISDLDSNQFEVRAKASAALEGMGTTAGPALRKALAGKPSAEVRRRIVALMEKIQSRIPPLKELREIRAVEILEYLAASSADATRLTAIDLLEQLAGGAPDARLTQEANAALRRRNPSGPSKRDQTQPP